MSRIRLPRIFVLSAGAYALVLQLVLGGAFMPPATAAHSALFASNLCLSAPPDGHPAVPEAPHDAFQHCALCVLAYGALPAGSSLDNLQGLNAPVDVAQPLWVAGFASAPAFAQARPRAPPQV